MFTSRLPLVWPGGSYTNNGVTTGGVSYYPSSSDEPILFRPDWQDQYTYTDFFGGTENIPSGQVDLFAEDFKFPQILRASLAVDQKLPWGLVGTLEAIFTKTLNNVIYYNYNVEPATKNLSGGPDNRPIYSRDVIESRYARIMVGDNTSEGYAFDITAQLQKNFSNGFQGSVAYTYGQAKSINDGLSSQNSSQWRYVGNVYGRNHLDLAYSNFDPGHRIQAFLSYKKDYADHFSTGLSIFYNGVSAKRFSYVYENSRILQGEDYSSSSNYALIWIPKDQSEINLVDIVDGDGNVTKTAEEQWEALNEFIDNDPYLSEHRGEYAERNGARTPFESYLDLRLIQDFYINAGKTRHTLQFTFDIFNFLNLLNSKWGVHRFVNYDSYSLIRANRLTGEDGTVPEFQYKGGTEREQAWNVSDPSSRWRMQIGIRYIFGTPKD